jgi:type IV pilus assembly protein PilN
MIHINLLPVRQIKQRLRVRNEVAIFLASMGLLTMLIISVAGGQIIKVNALSSENKILTAKKASYQPILEEIEKLKKDKKEQETKLDVIKKLKAVSQVTVRILDELAKIFPTNRLWLTSLRQSGNTMDLAGVALDNATIAQFMQNITESPYFSSALLSQAQQTAVAGAKLKSFSLSVGIEPPRTNGTEPVAENK